MDENVMDYNSISDFLEKFKKILFQKEEIYRITSEIINKHTNCLIEPSFIKIKNGIIHIQSSPIVKNEILIHKKEILFDLKEFIKTQNLIDIK